MLLRYLSIFCGLACCLLNWSCRETIEFEPPNTLKNAIFIDGKLTKGDPSRVVVTIGRVFDFVTNPSLFLADFVQIIDESGNVLDLTTRQQGVFTLDIPENHPTFKVEYGRSYKIRLQLRSGVIYESDFDKLYAVPELSELKQGKTEKLGIRPDGSREVQEIVTFSVNTSFLRTDEGEKSRLLWEYGAVYQQTDMPIRRGLGDRGCRSDSNEPKTCYIAFNPVNNYKTLDGNALTGEELTDFLIYEAINTNSFVFAEGYYLTVLQQSLSQQAYDYWAQVGTLTGRNGTVFEPPAGKIKTNWRNIDNPKDEVFGFFYVTESSLKRIYVAPSTAGNPRAICPPTMRPEPLCDNCLCQQNSTVEKPEWWVE